MYLSKKPTQTTAKRNESYEAEPLVAKINRILNNNEPISDTAPLIYSDRKDGVLPAYDIRTDRMEVALEALDKVSMTHKAKREEKAKLGEKEKTAGETEKQTGATATPTKAQTGGETQSK